MLWGRDNLKVPFLKKTKTLNFFLPIVEQLCSFLFSLIIFYRLTLTLLRTVKCVLLFFQLHLCFLANQFVP